MYIKKEEENHQPNAGGSAVWIRYMKKGDGNGQGGTVTCIQPHPSLHTPYETIKWKGYDGRKKEN